MWSHCSGSSAHLFTWDSWFFPLSMAWPMLGPRGKCHQRRLWLQVSWPADHCQRKAGSSLAQAHLVHGESTLAFPPVSEKDKESGDVVKFPFGTSVTLRETYQLSWALTFVFATSAKTTYFLRNSFLGKLFKNKNHSNNKNKGKKTLFHKCILWDTE